MVAVDAGVRHLQWFTVLFALNRIGIFPTEFPLCSIYGSGSWLFNVMPPRGKDFFSCPP